jgi:hypothetical protein
LPLGFFLDDALVNQLSLDPGIARLPAASGSAYLHCLKKYEVATSDGQFRFAGDTHFAFPIPEAAFEDGLVLESLRDAQVLSDKLAASLLMVDFPNPVFSARRAALLRYVPESAAIGPDSEFTQLFVDAVREAAAALTANSSEHEFIANWDQPDASWRASFESRIRAYFAALLSMMDDPLRFEPLFELADSRRREFRKRPLHEFNLTTPVSNIASDAPFLELRENGRVVPKL